MAGAVDIDAGTGQCQYKKKKGGKLTNNGYGNTGAQPGELGACFAGGEARPGSIHSAETLQPKGGGG